MTVYDYTFVFDSWIFTIMYIDFWISEMIISGTVSLSIDYCEIDQVKFSGSIEYTVSFTHTGIHIDVIICCGCVKTFWNWDHD